MRMVNICYIIYLHEHFNAMVMAQYGPIGNDIHQAMGDTL